MSDDIKIQIVQQIKDASFDFFAIQLDESTDISTSAHFMIFVKYVTVVHLRKSFFVHLSRNEYKSSRHF